MARPVTAAARTTDLLNAVDEYARDGLGIVPESMTATRGELLALRWAVEALTRVIQASPLIGEFVESFAAEMVAALELEEPT